jgi:choline dehydrogenase
MIIEKINFFYPLKRNYFMDSTGVNNIKKWDYIIVGLGAAGALLARYLSDDKVTSVLVLESGADRRTDPNVTTAFWPPVINDLMYDPRYAVTYPTAISPTTTMPYSEANMFGGSTNHNHMIGVKPSKELLDSWVAMTGDSSWSYANMLPLMKALETYTPNGTVINPLQRGTHGPIKITQQPPIGSNTFLTAINTITGTPYVDDYNDGTSICTSINQQLCTPGASPVRSSAANELFTTGVIIDGDGNGLDGRKLKIITNAKVLKFYVEGGKAKRVKYERYALGEVNIKEAKLEKNGTLILAGGAVQTPKLLFNSGIGPASELHALGIPVFVDSPNVGKNAKNHYGALAVVTGAVPDESHTFTNMSPYMPSDNIRRFQNSNFAQTGFFVAAGCVLNPSSSGTITINTPNLTDQPKLDMNFFSDGSVNTPGTDSYLVVSFLKLIKQAAVASGQVVLAPSNDMYPAPWGPAPDDTKLSLYAETSSGFYLSSHISGTTRMGTNISNGVVDGNLNVFGLSNVKICNLGVAPQMPDGNPCLSTYYIALNLLRKLGITI